MPVSRRSQSIKDQNEETNRNVEEIRRKNLEDNKAFLEGLLMTKIRDDFKSLTNTLQTTTKKETKKRDIKYITVAEPAVPIRRSRRLANLNADTNKIPSPESTSDQENERVIVKTYRRVTHKHEHDLTAEEQEALNEKVKGIFEMDSSIDQSKTHYEDKSLDVTDENVLKLTPDRVLFMDIHRRTDYLAIVGSDRAGTVGLVVKSTSDLDGPWSKLTFNIHKEYAPCCYFDVYQHNRFYSSSYDATLRCYDLVKNESIEIYKESDNHGLTAFDCLSDQVFLLTANNGDLLRIDTRSQPIETYDRYDITNKRIRSIHINPKQKHEFCLAGTDVGVKIYDLRNMSTIKYFLDSKRNCYGAYYNMMGSCLVATTRDDHLVSFSTEDMVNAKDPMNVSFKKRVYHRNYVNRFVTPFMAQPHGFFESHFLIGLDKNPRSITILDENCSLVSSLSSENLNSLATINVAHPTLPIVVGGNSSGRIHVFTGQK